MDSYTEFTLVGGHWIMYTVKSCNYCTKFSFTLYNYSYNYIARYHVMIFIHEQLFHNLSLLCAYVPRYSYIMILGCVDFAQKFKGYCGSMVK